jgi:hypothetical protein
MRTLLALLKSKRRSSIAPRAEIVARGEGFRLSRGADVFEGICYLDYYRDEWSKLTLMSDSIRQVSPAGSAPLTSEQQDAIAVEAMHLLQLRQGNTQVGVARNAA